ncbi:MAG: hypothetical protein PVI73_08770, partial [Syntrophobacterales bacterium]
MTENTKSQIPNSKKITMTKIQNSKPLFFFDYCNLGFICNLVLVIWYLINFDSRTGDPPLPSSCSSDPLPIADISL